MDVYHDPTKFEQWDCKAVIDTHREGGDICQLVWKDGPSEYCDDDLEEPELDHIELQISGV